LDAGNEEFKRCISLPAETVVAQRRQWQDEPAQLQRLAAAEGERGLADLVEAIQALLADDGRAAGLGAGLEEPFAAVWRRIVEEL